MGDEAVLRDILGGVDAVVDAVADAVADTVTETVAEEAAGGGHWIQGDTWLLNLTSLAEGLQGVNLTEGVNLQGWVLNITALVEDLPLTEFIPALSLREWMQWIITIITIAFSTQWIIMRIQKYMCVPARGRQRTSRSRFPISRRGASRPIQQRRSRSADPSTSSPALSPSPDAPGARREVGTTPCSSPSTRD